MTWRRPTGAWPACVAFLGLGAWLLIAAGCGGSAASAPAGATSSPNGSGAKSSMAATPAPNLEIRAARTAKNSAVLEALSLGDQYRSSGLPDKAAEKYQEALDIDPENPEIYPRLGYALVEAQDFERAVRVYQRYVELRPKDCNSHASLGFAYLRHDMADQAIVSYEEALKLCRDDPNAYSNLGKAYLAGGYELEALEAFRRAIELNPGDVIAYEKLADLLWNRKLLPEALAVYEAILAMPDNGKNEAWTAFASGRIAAGYKWGGAIDKAIPFFEAQVAYDSTNVTALRGLAQAYEEVKMTDKAIVGYYKLIKASGDTPVASHYYRLADLLNQVGRHEKAIEVAKLGESKDESCPAYAYYVKGIAYEKLGGIPNYKRAKREFQKCRDCGNDTFSRSAVDLIQRQDDLITRAEKIRQKEGSNC